MATCRSTWLKSRAPRPPERKPLEEITFEQSWPEFITGQVVSSTALLSEIGFLRASDFHSRAGKFAPLGEEFPITRLNG